MENLTDLEFCKLGLLYANISNVITALEAVIHL
jgi:hypothetical protein